MAVLAIANFFNPEIISQILSHSIINLANLTGITLSTTKLLALGALINGVFSSLSNKSCEHFKEKMIEKTALEVWKEYGAGKENFFDDNILANESYRTKILKEDQELKENWQSKYY